MKSEVLTKFENPTLIVIGMLLFILVFGWVFFRTISNKRNQEFEEASKLPFEEVGKQ